MNKELVRKYKGTIQELFRKCEEELEGNYENYQKVRDEMIELAEELKGSIKIHTEKQKKLKPEEEFEKEMKTEAKL